VRILLSRLFSLLRMFSFFLFFQGSSSLFSSAAITLDLNSPIVTIRTREAFGCSLTALTHLVYYALILTLTLIAFSTISLSAQFFTMSSTNLTTSTLFFILFYYSSANLLTPFCPQP
jgi:hypothetical protein